MLTAGRIILPVCTMLHALYESVLLVCSHGTGTRQVLLAPLQRLYLAFTCDDHVKGVGSEAARKRQGSAA